MASAFENLSDEHKKLVEAEFPKHVGYMSFETIKGDAEAIFGLRDRALGLPIRPTGPFCSIRFKAST